MIKIINENIEPPYSKEEYNKAQAEGLDLDDWNDYVKYWGLGEEEEYI